MAQAAGSWSVGACCAANPKRCGTFDGQPCSGNGCAYCYDHRSSSGWLFGLWPGPPQRFESTAGGGADTSYQLAMNWMWPQWGGNGELSIGGSDAPGKLYFGNLTSGYCMQGIAYRGTDREICGGDGNWGATDVEVWYPR